MCNERSAVSNGVLPQQIQNDTPARLPFPVHPELGLLLCPCEGRFLPRCHVVDLPRCVVLLPSLVLRLLLVVAVRLRLRTAPVLIGRLALGSHFVLPGGNHSFARARACG